MQLFPIQTTISIWKSIVCITARFAPANDCVLFVLEKLAFVALLSGTVRFQPYFHFWNSELSVEENEWSFVNFSHIRLSIVLHILKHRGSLSVGRARAKVRHISPSWGWYRWTYVSPRRHHRHSKWPRLEVCNRIYQRRMGRCRCMVSFCFCSPAAAPRNCRSSKAACRLPYLGLFPVDLASPQYPTKKKMLTILQKLHYVIAVCICWN